MSDVGILGLFSVFAILIYFGLASIIPWVLTVILKKFLFNKYLEKKQSLGLAILVFFMLLAAEISVLFFSSAYWF